MSDKENRRKCFKCCSSPAEDGVKLFRFPNPGKRNLFRCESWARYVFPDGDYTLEVQKKLYSEHRMLCERHFDETDFTDSQQKHLSRTAIPCDSKHECLPTLCFSQPGPSHPREPLGERSNIIEVAEVQPISIKSTEREKDLFKKCSKYVTKICQLQNRLKSMKSKIKVLKEIEDDNAVRKLSRKISPAFALLLQGQIKNSKCHLKGRRWSKEEKIIALRLFKRSPTCYRLLRRLITLPAPSTLKNFLNRVPFGVGVNEPVFQMLKKFVKTQKPGDNEFILMFDEMSIKKHICYECKSDIIEGFQDHGMQGRSGLIASYALVFMIGGIRKKIKQPIAHFFSSGCATADRLAVLIKEVLQQCREAGVHISATVCDMDGVNRRALTILGASTEHPYINIENKEIVVMYDTPHLIKCFRNMFLKYNIECSTDINSNLQTGRGIAKWEHIKEFYEMDSKNSNFVFAPCLRKEHLDPNTKQKMKVKLAVQVLSHSVAAGMFSKISDGSLTAAATTTANVVANMDKLFDCLNSESSDLRRGKRHATNLTATSPHLIFFQNMKSFFKTLKFIGSPRKPPSQEGWIWTLNAIERLWKNLQQKYNVKSLATRRLQQDALENLFGCIRGNCGSNINPTCGQFVAGLKAAIISNLSHMGTTGNCETDNNVIINNFNNFLSVSQSHQQKKDDSVVTASSTSTSALYFEVDEAITTNNPEIQACAYVAGFILKKLPINDCEICRKIFVTDNTDVTHIFVENREYETDSRALNYAHKDFICCVELCASAINIFLKDNAFVKMIKIRILDHIRIIVNFDFIQPCILHKDENLETITNSVFFICVKRFCILKNRSFTEEAAASSLKRKMKIILHQ